MDVLLTTLASYVTRDLVNRGGEPAKIALGLLKLTVPSASTRRFSDVMGHQQQVGEHVRLVRAC